MGATTPRRGDAKSRQRGLRDLMPERVFTRLGKALRRDSSLSPEKVEETAEVVAQQVRHARDLGAERIAIVATAAVRQAHNREELVDAIERATQIRARVLTDDEEARLAF